MIVGCLGEQEDRKKGDKMETKPRKKFSKKAKDSGLKMNFSRAISIIKSKCSIEWARAHAKSIPITRKKYGLRGVYAQVLIILREVEDWDDDYGAVAFLRQWADNHREEAETSA